MKVLVVAPDTQRELADRIGDALARAGHVVAVESGEREGRRSGTIRRPQLVVLVLAPGALEPGGHVIRRLERTARRWPDPTGRVIPVLAEPVPLEDIPPYLRSITFLVPGSDAAADVVGEVGQIARARESKRLRRAVLLAAGFASVLVAAAFLLSRSADSRPPRLIMPLDTIVLPESLAQRARVVSTPGLPELAARAAVCVPLVEVDEARCTADAREELERYYFIGAVDPDVLLRVSHDGVVVGRAALGGEPRSIAFSRDTIYVATAAGKVHAFVGDSLSPAWSRDIHAADAVNGDPSPAPSPLAIASARDTLWLLLEGGGEARVLFLDRPDRRWRSIDPATLDGVPVHLVRIGDEVWLVTEDDHGDAALVRIAPGSPTVFQASDPSWTTCARDIADAAGDLLVLTCDGELVDLRVNGDRLELLLRYGRLPFDRATAVAHSLAAGLGGWTVATVDHDAGGPLTRIFRVVPGAQPWPVLERAGIEPVSFAAAGGTTFIVARDRAGKTLAWLVAGSGPPLALPEPTP